MFNLLVSLDHGTLNIYKIHCPLFQKDLIFFGLNVFVLVVLSETAFQMAAFCRGAIVDIIGTFELDNSSLVRGYYERCSVSKLNGLCRNTN